MNFEFFIPFALPIGLFSLGTVIDSILNYGQVLAFDDLKEKGIKLILTHYSRFAYQFYFACFGYDLQAMTSFAIQTKDCVDILKYPALTLSISLGVSFHILAYFHSYYIQKVFESKRFPKPMTVLHLFYTPVSIYLIYLIRVFEYDLTK